MTNNNDYADWLEIPFNNCVYKKFNARFHRRISRFQTKHPFDAIAFRGMSGALLAPFVAHKVGVSLLMVRKTRSHDKRLVSGDFNAKRYVILDDIVSSGATLAKIRSRISVEYRKQKLKPPVLVGVFLYATDFTHIIFNKGNIGRLPLDVIEKHDIDVPVLRLG